MFSDNDIAALILTVKLASTVSVLLIVMGTPIAWWLATTKSWLKAPIGAIVALPLVLPPTVIGFYMLLAMGPNGPIGAFTNSLGIQGLAFSFWGLVFASIFYSMPFVIQPIQNAFESINTRTLEVAAVLGASPLDRFFTVAIPQAKSGFLTALVLGFAHTVGEFGVVLMIGGNIPNETRVVSVQIYDHVESLNYDSAHNLSILMIGFSFVILMLLYLFRRRSNTSMLI